MKRILKIKRCISLVLLFTISISLFSVYGCNNDETSVTPPQAQQTTTINGTINTSEIGGSNLQVQSAFKQNSIVNNGQFSTEVSKMGTQLLFIADGSQQVRGLTLSIIQNGSPVAIIADGISTAYSLLFMIPGILSTEPDTTSKRITRLSALNSFQQFSNYLRNNLSSNTLGNLMNEKLCQDLYLQTVLEFTALDTNANVVDDNDPNFIVNKINSSTLELINKNWRDVNVYRRDLKADGNQLGPIQSIQTPMKGAVPWSFGCFFTNTCRNPTIKNDDSFAQISSVVDTAEYWVIGPGLLPNINPPSGLNTNIILPIISSLITYMYYPLIGLVTGGLGFLMGLEQSFPASLEVARSLSNETNVVGAALRIASAQNATEFSREVVNALFNPLVFTTIVTSLAAFSVISSVTASSLIALLPVIVTVNLSFVIANAIIMGILVAASPKYSRYAVSVVSVQSNLVAYYPFNGNPNDESGNNNNGINNGATLTIDRFNNPNSAYNFDGVNNYILVSSNNGLQFGTSDVTVCAWIKTSQTSSAGRIINRGECNGSSGWQLTFDNGTNSIVVGLQRGGGAAYFRGSRIVNDNQWHFLSWSRRNNFIKLFIDGTADGDSGSFTVSLTNLNSSLKIGKGDSPFTYPFRGTIDDIRIYNRALSDSEIQTLYHEGGW